MFLVSNSTICLPAYLDDRMFMKKAVGMKANLAVGVKASSESFNRRFEQAIESRQYVFPRLFHLKTIRT